MTTAIAEESVTNRSAKPATLDDLVERLGGIPLVADPR